MDIILRYSGRRVSNALLVVSKHISIVIPAALTSEWLRIERLETEQADIFQIDLYPTLDITHLNLCDNIDSFNLPEVDEDPGEPQPDVMQLRNSGVLLSSLQEHGWLPSSPLVVFQGFDDLWHVLDGHLRLCICILHQRAGQALVNNIPCLVFSKSFNDEPYFDNRVYNAMMWFNRNDNHDPNGPPVRWTMMGM